MSIEPESWEDFEDTSSRLNSLNINATAFIPNVTAAPFVPRFAQHTSDNFSLPSQTQSNGHVYQPNQMDNHSTDLNIIHSKDTNIITLEGEEKYIKVDEEVLEKDEVIEELIEDKETVQKDNTMDVDEEILSSPEPEDESSPEPVKRTPRPIKPKEKRKDNLNIVFIGHVDAGKSTIGGHILYLTGQVDKRTLEKFEREAKEMNRESWYLSWALDTNDEERDKGKTVEVGRGFFETEKKRFTLLDAPGHRCFVSNMIGGAAQADVGILVISARKGEFETGFDRGGQTREHALLAKTAGVKHLIVLINKMDDPSVEWDEQRYDDITNRLLPFLKQSGFRQNDINFMPASGLTGANLKEPLSPKVCPWYTGPPFLTYLDGLPSFKDVQTDKPFRLSIVEKFKDMGTIVMGKVISGECRKNDNLVIMPNKALVQVAEVLIDDEESDVAEAGDNVKLKLRNIEEEDISPGMVLCSPDNLCKIADLFLAKIQLVELRNIIAPGFNCIMHIHSAVVEVSFQELVGKMDKKTGKKMVDKQGRVVKPRCAKEREVIVAKLQLTSPICIESFDQFQQLGRFMLRDEGKTIAVGMVLKTSEHLSSQIVN